MLPILIVLDTNIVVAALRSRRGASFRLLSLLETSGKFEINLSVPLVLEYEDVARRPNMVADLDEADISDVLDFVCLKGHHHRIFFLWRPILKDPKDDMILEVAVASQSRFIVTFNKRDFRGAEKFGIEVVTPLEFLRQIGELP